MRKIVAGVLLTLCVLLGGIFYWMQSNTDSVPPVIAISEEEIVYEEGQDKTVLLKGVTATDDMNGDVSDTLMVDSVIPTEDNLTATVVYYAKDRSNNVAKATRIVAYRPADHSMDWLNETESETTSSKKKKKEKTNTETEADQGNEASSAEEGAQASEGETSGAGAENEKTSAGSPKIDLTVQKVTIQVGASFNPLEYVRDIEDDKDTRDHLFGQIHIDSNTVNTSVPGEYEVVYSVTDSDNNLSNRPVLRVIVEE